MIGYFDLSVDSRSRTTSCFTLIALTTLQLSHTSGTATGTAAQQPIRNERRRGEAEKFDRTPYFAIYIILDVYCKHTNAKKTTVHYRAPITVTTVLDVTLSRITQSGDPSPCVRDPYRDLACMCQTKRRPESIVHEHMSGQEGRRPPVTLDLEDTRLRYDTYQIDYMYYPAAYL